MSPHPRDELLAVYFLVPGFGQRGEHENCAVLLAVLFHQTPRNLVRVPFLGEPHNEPGWQRRFMHDQRWRQRFAPGCALALI